MLKKLAQRFLTARLQETHLTRSMLVVLAILVTYWNTLTFLSATQAAYWLLLVTLQLLTATQLLSAPSLALLVYAAFVTQDTWLIRTVFANSLHQTTA